MPIVNYSMFLGGVKKLNIKISEMLNNFILYETWGRKTGSETLEEYGWTNESMTKLLAEAYENAAKEIGADVAHVGQNFHKVYKAHAEIELYNEENRILSLYNVFSACQWPKYQPHRDIGRTDGSSGLITPFTNSLTTSKYFPVDEGYSFTPNISSTMESGQVWVRI